MDEVGDADSEASSQSLQQPPPPSLSSPIHKPKPAMPPLRINIPEPKDRKFSSPCPSPTGTIR